MPHKHKQEFRTQTHNQITHLYDELSVPAEKRSLLNTIITGHEKFEQMTEGDLSLLITLLTELVTKPNEEREVTLEVLLIASKRGKGSSE